MMLCTPFQFQSPCSIMVVGPSSCGKTVFVEKLMRERSRLFTPPYNPVVYCYGANQPTTFKRMKKKNKASISAKEFQIPNYWKNGIKNQKEDF